MVASQLYGQRTDSASRSVATYMLLPRARRGWSRGVTSVAACRVSAGPYRALVNDQVEQEERRCRATQLRALAVAGEQPVRREDPALRCPGGGRMPACFHRPVVEVAGVGLELAVLEGFPPLTSKAVGLDIRNLDREERDLQAPGCIAAQSQRASQAGWLHTVLRDS